MQTISVEQAKVGDVLAEPLLNREGKVLLPKGARLSPAVVSRMQGWGISTLAVDGSGSSESDGAEGRVGLYWVVIEMDIR